MSPTPSSPAVPPGETPCATVAAALRGATRCVLLTHEHPDGDGTGSMLALRLGLIGLGKSVTCASPQGCPARYSHLPGAGEITDSPVAGGHDVAVALDCDGPGRLAGLFAVFEGAPLTVSVDHHAAQNAFAQLNWVDGTKAATGLLVRELLGCLGCELTPEIATCLYTAIATDTGFFRFQNTSAEALSCAAELLAAGVDAAEVARRAAEQMPLAKARLLGRALSSVRTWGDGAVLVAVLGGADFEATGALAEHTDGIIDELKRVQGGEVLALMREESPGDWRVSMRSVEADVVAICRRFKGGGHKLAAGCEAKGSADELAELFAREGLAALEALRRDERPA